MFVCAGSIETFPFAKPVGVGMVETAASVALLCEKERPRELVFVGTAGSYGRYGLLEIVEAHAAVQIEIAALQVQAYTPMRDFVAYRRGNYHIGYSADVSRETSPIVNSSNYITTDAQAAEAMLARGIDLENMEFFAVLATAARYGIPAKGIFIVTNYCREDAHAMFVSQHAEAKNRLTEYVITRYIDTKREV